MGDDQERFQRPGSYDVGDMIRVLEAAMRIVDLRTRLDRIEHKIDKLVSVTARTDMTAAQEEKVQVELTDLDKIANQAPKQT